MSNNHDLIQQLNNKLQNLPPDVLDASGRFLYSRGATMKKGGYYLIGLNPGGDPKDYPLSLRKEMSNWENRAENAYLDEEWENKKGRCAKGQHPYQAGVKKLCDIFKVDVRDVCASNWILTRSSNSEELRDKKSLIETFAPVQDVIMRIVQPAIVFAIGKETFDIASEHFSFGRQTTRGEEKNWRIYVAERKYNGEQQKLIGFPHFSRYDWYDLSKGEREKNISDIANGK